MLILFLQCASRDSSIKRHSYNYLWAQADRGFSKSKQLFTNLSSMFTGEDNLFDWAWWHIELGDLALKVQIEMRIIINHSYLPSTFVFWPSILCQFSHSLSLWPFPFNKITRAKKNFTSDSFSSLNDILVEVDGHYWKKRMVLKGKWTVKSI